MFGTLLISSFLSAVSNQSATAFSARDDARQGFSRSGDDALDQAFIAELKRIVSVLNINPGFQYIDEMNSYSTIEVYIPGTKGTVFFGVPLIKMLMMEPDGGIAVAGIAAHECAHVLQYVIDIPSKLRTTSGSVTLLELHADFLAGYYIGRRNGDGSSSIIRLSSALYKFGDYDFKSPAHHGTPAKRSAAAEKGYAVAQNGGKLQDAIEAGMKYVKEL
ncbi:hypothetical protein [Microvirga sesbaniae]|uniref:hypothetical protein n=1 Tax=Microvirga sesbaniae TaxID=681392 RepID=UPI0021CA14B0|nr:hypothetical protein [Microvirga sp. HBU67692]